MDRKTVEVARFLLEWAPALAAAPVEGALDKCYFCFVASAYSRGKDKVSWIQFGKCLRQIDDLGGGVLECEPAGALEMMGDDPFGCVGRILWVDRLALGLLIKKGEELTPPSSSGSCCNVSGGGGNVTDTSCQVADSCNWPPPKCAGGSSAPSLPSSRAEQLSLLLHLVNGKTPWEKEKDGPGHVTGGEDLTPRSISDVYALTGRGKRLEQLTHLLRTPGASHALQRERARVRTSMREFFDCCEDSDHATQLGPLTTFDKTTSYCRINADKFKREARRGLAECVGEKLHFIPIMQAQTDPKLGDCSYLDTCHKMSSCRYVHYGQLLPLKYGEETAEARDHNAHVRESMRVWDYTRGEPTALYTKRVLPKQWINTDITQLDFAALGDDFGVVIADPSWTIHMNLNYSSLKDDELAGLRMDKLQREGLLLLWVTGRTIETGRDFLKRWGYSVENQVTWIKTSQLIRTISTGRTGHWLNHSKEHLLVGVKGNPKWLNRGVDPQLLISSTRETSRKPDELYGIVDRMVGEGVRKLEIFGRQHNTREGWLTVGNQLEPTNVTSLEQLSRMARAEVKAH